MHEQEAKQHVKDGTPNGNTRDELYGAMLRFSNIMKQTSEQLEGNNQQICGVRLCLSL